jgi:hypothetical protein
MEFYTEATGSISGRKEPDRIEEERRLITESCIIHTGTNYKNFVNSYKVIRIIIKSLEDLTKLQKRY